MTLVTSQPAATVPLPDPQRLAHLQPRSEYRWFNSHEPQTLQIAADPAVPERRAVPAQRCSQPADPAGAVAAFGIANEKKWWGYWLGGVVSAYAVGRYVQLGIIQDVSLIKVVTIPVIFAVALLVALLHEQSRGYRRIWFK